MQFDTNKIIYSIGAILIFYAITYGITVFRKKQQLEITINDIILAVIPFALLFGVMGYISSVKISDFEIAFTKASNSPIKLDVTELPIEDVNYERKDGKDYLEVIVKSRPQALSFNMGYQNYDSKIMEQYLRRLSGDAKYVFFFESIDEDGKLLAIIEMPILYQQLFSNEFEEGDQGFLNIKKLYEIIDKNDKKALLSIKGMIPYSDAITPQTSKIEVLEKMSKLKTKLLPVNDTTSYLTKVVLKEDVTTSLLLEVSKALNAQNLK
jgi:hypothetical protein